MRDRRNPRGRIIEVTVGDNVETKQRIGKLSSSSNSSQPHLHFQLSDGPDVLTSNGIPFVIDRYTFVGSVTPDSTGEDIRIVGTPSDQLRPYSLYPSVTDFC
jgi:murein DD-endopeptidase MepM/ murein hydrolase activator NlpD